MNYFSCINCYNSHIKCDKKYPTCTKCFVKKKKCLKRIGRKRGKRIFKYNYILNLDDLIDLIKFI